MHGIDFHTEVVREYIANGAVISEEKVACPYGIHDDPLSGLCALYIDRDGNRICDYSE